MSTTKPTAAVYLRKSTVDAKGIFESHERNVGALAKRLGARLDPSLRFVEDDVSASKPRRADTAWGRLLAAVEREKPAFVLAQAADRLGRRLADLEGLDDLARRVGLKVHTVTEGDLFASPIWPFIAARSKTEAMYTSIRVKAAQEKRRREGKPSGGGNRPYGFASDRVTIIDEEAAIVQEIARRLIGGERAFAIAADLNDRGCPTTDRGRWSWQAVKIIATGRTTRAQKIGGTGKLNVAPKIAKEIQRRVAEGETHAQVAADLNRRGVPCPIEPAWTVGRIRDTLSRPRYTGLLTHHGEIVGEGSWGAILDRSTWTAVQQVLAETSHATGRPYGSLLGGLAVCLACVPPEPMWSSGWGDKAGSKIYKCARGHGARRQDVLEDHVLSRVLPAVNNDEIAARQDAIMVDSQPLRNQIVGLELEMSEATEAYHSGQIEGRDFYPLLGRLRKDHDAAEREHAKLMREFDALNESRSEREHWDSLSHEERRAFLRRHLVAVEVRPRAKGASIASPIAEGEVRLVWRDRPTPTESPM